MTEPSLDRRERSEAAVALPGELEVLEAAEAALAGHRHGLSALWPFLGPAFIASVAYIDPGNFATNMAAGAKYGYLLVWVIVMSNLMAMLVQAMSAKLGIATGLNLAEVCRRRFPRRVNIALWLQAELIAMATDLAEFVGAALALNLLFGMPMLLAGVVTGIIVFGVLWLQERGVRHLEATVAGFVGVIVIGFAFQVFLANPSATGIAGALLKPQFAGTGSLLLATGILGATVMPHVIYLHSALTQHRVRGATEEQTRRIYRFELVDVIIAMSIAGFVNVSMLVIAASTFYAHGLTDIVDLNQVYALLGSALGAHADIIFGVALLASGLSSSSVGTLAGQVVMQGFVERRIPLLARRVMTMTPALIVIAIGVNPSQALILSQVVLSFGIPFALIPLVLFTKDRGLMGGLVNLRITTIALVATTIVIVALNIFLIIQLAGA